MRPTQLEVCCLIEYSLSYDVHHPAARFSFRPARMAPPIRDQSLATRCKEKIRDEDTSPRGYRSEASVSTLHKPVEDGSVSQSGLSFTPCPPGWSQSPWRHLTAEESSAGVRPNLGDIVWFQGREGVVVNNDWLEGKKAQIQDLSPIPRERPCGFEDRGGGRRGDPQCPRAPTVTPECVHLCQAPSEAFAWLAGGDATSATCTEVRVTRGAVPTFSGKMAISSRPLKSLLVFWLASGT